MGDFLKYLTRDQLCELLQAHGYPISKSTLEKLSMPSRGEGPPVAGWWPGHKNDRPLYLADEGLAWAQARLKLTSKCDLNPK